MTRKPRKRFLTFFTQKSEIDEPEARHAGSMQKSNFQMPSTSPLFSASLFEVT
jgi:hypothetical protein